MIPFLYTCSTMYSLLLFLLDANHLGKSAQAPQSPVTTQDQIFDAQPTAASSKNRIWTLSVEKFMPNLKCNSILYSNLGNRFHLNIRLPKLGRCILLLALNITYFWPQSSHEVCMSAITWAISHPDNFDPRDSASKQVSKFKVNIQLDFHCSWSQL